MINLLPPAKKESYRYAARNTSLIKWIFAALISLAGVGVIATYGLLAMEQSINTYSNRVSQAQETLKKEKLSETEAKVKDISGSFKLVVSVLSKEVLFSKLLQQIATTMPPNVDLIDLNISQVQGGIDITAAASDYNTATQVQVNLSDPSNKIFSKADIVSITCDSKSTNDPGHPCTVQLRALFVNAKDNPFLFINNKGAGA